MKKLFLIIGAPGSGKTTDAEIIANENENITHYSTGDMLRDEVASGSEIGKELDSYMSKGLIVPIDIVIKTITNAMKSAPTEIIILDGYPRSIEQLKSLEEFLSNDTTIKLVNVIEVEVSEETAKDRVLGRNRGDDDNEKVFNNRMKVYLEPLKEIKEFYTKQNKLETVSGEGSIEEVVGLMKKYIH